MCLNGQALLLGYEISEDTKLKLDFGYISVIL